MKKSLKSVGKFIIYSLVVLLVIASLAFALTYIFIRPSNDRVWALDQQVLPYATVAGNLITIHNIRNFTYISTKSYTPDYYDKTFDLNAIKKVWYVVEPFSGAPGAAHTFLSFEFDNDQFIAISVEIRKEQGESFNPIKGLFNQYELMYVIADERDVIKLRSNYRKDLVYVYPAKTTKEKMQKLFVSMIERANELKTKPEFYNTIVNTCTTNIVRHVNIVTPGRAPLLNKNILFPENSDELAYKLGLIDTDLSFEEARERYFINDRALKYGNDPDFSVRIRQAD